MGILRTAALLATLALPGAAWAQETFELKGTSWVNGRELHLDRLKGKVVVIYFFEEN